MSDGLSCTIVVPFGDQDYWFADQADPKSCVGHQTARIFLTLKRWQEIAKFDQLKSRPSRPLSIKVTSTQSLFCLSSSNNFVFVVEINRLNFSQKTPTKTVNGAIC